MTNKQFSEALSQISDRYIIETINFRNKKGKKKYSLLAACLILALILCGFAFAVHSYLGVGSAEDASFKELTQPFETTSSTEISENAADETFFTKSDIISDYSEVYADNSVCVTVEGEKIPSVYFSPNYMIIFTQKDEKGWTLEEGDQFMIDVSLYDQQSITMEIGYILDGKYYNMCNTLGPDFSNVLNVTEDGDYYFCITNRSSANAVIESGDIKIK